MKRETSKADIIIPVYNNLAYTQKCLWAIEAHTVAPYQLTVVDNGSTDGTDEFLDRFVLILMGRGHKLITCKTNLGFARAVNLGIRASGPAPYVVLLNNDVEVYHGWLTTLIEAMEANPRIGAMGVLSTAKTQATYEGRFYPCGAQVFAQYKLGQLPYSCVILRRRAIDDVGLLDEEFFLYGEDDDLNIRLMQAGWKLAIHTGITVKHAHGATSKAAGLQHYRKAAMERILMKWGPQVKLVCIMRVKDAKAKIRRALDSMPFVDKFIIVLNDSTDGTESIVSQYPSTVLYFTEGLDAARDLNLAYQEALEQGATHVLWIDSDEEWEARAAEELPKLLAQDVAGWMFQIFPFVLSKTHYRTDGPWAQFTGRGQTRLFQAQGGVFWASKRKAHSGPPHGLRGLVAMSDLRIKHWTVESEEEAERKIAFYEAHDLKDYGHLRDGSEAIYEEWIE